MHCPKCGHQAVSNNVQFCPGCGFRMDGVAELVANDGLFATDEEKPTKPRRSLVKRGALLGATLTVIGVPLTFLILPLFPYKYMDQTPWIIYISYCVALMALIGASGYLKRLITNMTNIFSEEESSSSNRTVSPSIPTLPAAQRAPVADSVKQFVDTAKMGHPSSVTEQTTSRLNKV